MGQSASITDYSFNEITDMINKSPIYKSDEWISSTDKKSNSITYKIPTNKNLMVTIAENEWPVQKKTEKMILNHHYYHIQASGKKYHYDVDTEEWVGVHPPERIINFSNKFQSLITSAEENPPQIKNKEDMTGGYNNTNKIHELQLIEDISYQIPDLLANIKSSNKNLMFITENDCNCDPDDNEEQVNAFITVSSDLSYVTRQIEDQWSRAISVIDPDSKYDKINIKINNKNFSMVVKSLNQCFTMNISNIDDENMEKIITFLDQNNIPFIQ